MKLISQNLTIHIKDNIFIKQLASLSDHHAFFSSQADINKLLLDCSNQLF